MAEHINGINPNILKWARERSGYTTEAIANALNKRVSIVNDWESGERALTYVQLETLADKYKRPIAIFFFPEPPEEPNIVEKLALRSVDIDQLDPHIHILFRQAYARQLSLMELNMNTNPSKNKIFRDFQAQPNDSATVLAQRVRLYMDINVRTQADWDSATDALKNWREQIEERGTFVFKDAFKNNSIDGFCLVHDEFPIIYLNNSQPVVRQIFSLFHELAHLLLGRNGITRGIRLEDGKVETFCNQFAAEFLVPSDDLKTRLNFSAYDDDAIEELANHYKVSRPVILLKLINNNILTQRDYRKMTRQWVERYNSYQEKKSNDNTSGGNYYNTLAAYLGDRFMELAFSKYRHGHFSIEQLAEHLNVKVKHLPQLEDCLLRRALR